MLGVFGVLGVLVVDLVFFLLADLEAGVGVWGVVRMVRILVLLRGVFGMPYGFSALFGEDVN